MASRGLGRGLDSLIPVNLKPGNASAAQFVPMSQVHANRYQPRKHFKEEPLKELSDSIREQGLLQPLVVTPVEDGKDGAKYIIIAGERRFRAAKLAGLTEVPIIVKKVSDKELLQLSLIENLQREDLNPIEEADAFKRFMEEFKLTQEELSRTLGKGRVVIANTLRLLNLPDYLKQAVSDGTISAGHARNLVSVTDEKAQRDLADKIFREKISVREAEKLVAGWKEAVSSGRVKTAKRKDPEIRQLEESLQQSLGTRVEVRARGKGKTTRGTVSISYFSLDDLDRIVKILKRK